MTLNLMLVNRAGIWISSDLRIVDPRTGRLIDDFSVKQVTLQCTDGVAAIAYCGVGAVGGVHLSDWMREVLRGESRTVDESLIYLRERATADLGPVVGRGIAGIRHTFSIGAFVQGQPWVVQIRNFSLLNSRTMGPAMREFQTVGKRIDSGGQHLALGTLGAVLPDDVELLAKVSHVTPRSPSEFLALLAGVNKRASKTRVGATYVSPHCVSVFMPPSGAPCEGLIHSFEGANKPTTVPHLLFGIDLTEQMRVGLECFDLDDTLWAERSDHAGSEAITPRNRLRCR